MTYDNVLWVVLFSFLALIATLLHFFSEPFRWRFAYLPGKSDAQKKLNDVFFATSLASYLLPFKLGVPLRVILLKRYCNIEARFLMMLMFIDGAVSITCWGVFVIIVVWIAAVRWSPPRYVIGVAALLLAIAVVVSIFNSERLKKLGEVLALFDQPAVRLSKAGVVFVADIASYGVRHTFLIMLFTRDISFISLGAVAGVVATFAGIASGLPLGLLGYDATLIAILSAGGVGTVTAIEVIVANRLLNIIVAVMLGAPASFRLGLGSGIVSIMRKLRDLGRAES